MSVKEDLRIDQHNLDHEWLHHPALVEKYHGKLSELQYDRDRVKIKLETEFAKACNDIRCNPVEYEVKGNITDGKVKEIATALPEIVELKKDLAWFEKEVTAAYGVKKALADRKDALQDLVRLYLSGYWATPRIKNDDKRNYQADDKFQEEALKGSERMKRRRETDG